MKKLENITTLLKKISNDSSPISSKKIKEIAKEIYLERMLNQVSANKIDNIIISNKGLKKQSEESNNFIWSMISLNMLILSMVAILGSMIIQNLKDSLTVAGVDGSLFYFLIFLVLTCFVSLLYTLKIKVKTKSKMKNRLTELNQDIKPDDYKEIIKNASFSILNDLEKIDGYINEKDFMKNFIIAKDGFFDNDSIKDIEKELKKEFYENLIVIEKDISNKLILQPNINNEMLKVKT